MNREPQSNSGLKERIIEWLKKAWASFRVWFKHYWQLFVAMLKKVLASLSINAMDHCYFSRNFLNY